MRVQTAVLLATIAGATLCAAGADWSNVGPETGTVGPLAFDSRDASTVYAGTGTGLFVSRDGGATWSNFGLTGWNVVGIALDPQDSGVLYVSTFLDRGDGDGTNQVFTTLDGGATWTEADSGLPLQGSCCIELLPVARQTGATVYALAGSPRALFKSADGGANWSWVDSLPGHYSLVSVAIDPQNSATLYVAMQGADTFGRSLVSLFKSLDAGATWREADSGFPSAQNGLAYWSWDALAIDPRNPGTVYATRMGLGVFKSTDAGASWRAANSGLPIVLLAESVLTSCCSRGVVIDPQDPNTLYAPGLNAADLVIYKSTNGGVSWQAVHSLGGTGYADLAVDSSRNVYAGTYRGRLKSADGGITWSDETFTLRANPVSALAFDPQFPGTLYAGAGPVFKTDDAGADWYPINMSFGAPVAALAADPRNSGTLYAGTRETKVEDGDPVPCGPSSPSGIFKTADAGANWIDTNAGIGCISAISIDPQNPDIVYAGTWFHGVYKTIDGGATWSATNSGIPDGPAGIHIDAVAVDPNTSGTVYAASAAGVFKSTDGGANWIDAGLPAPAYAVAADPQNTGTVYAAAADGLYKITGQEGWRNVLPSASAGVYAVAVDPGNPATIYAGTDTGVARSMDGGESWTPLAGGPGRVRLLALDPRDPNTLYAGGPGGLFAIRLGSVNKGTL